MKHILSLLLALVLSLTLLALPALAVDSVTIHTAANVASIAPGSSFTYSISLSGTFDGFAFYVPQREDLVVTDVAAATVEGISRINVDLMADGSYLVSIMPGCNLSDLPVTEIATVSVTVSGNTAPGTYSLSLDRVQISSRTGDPVADLRTDYAAVTVAKPLPSAHTLSFTAAREATCTTEGNLAYWYCAVCRKYFADAEENTELPSVTLPLDPNHHGKLEIRNAARATADKDGYTGDSYCVDCGKLVTKGKTIPKTALDTYDPAYDPAADDKRGAAENRDEGRRYDRTDDTEDKFTYVDPSERETPWENPFRDVSAQDSYYAAVAFVYENGLFKGVSSTEFAPQTTMTRAMFVTVLGRLAAVQTEYFTAPRFTDVPLGEWYSPYVDWASGAGIVKGYNEKIFGLNDEITVEQAVVILARYAQYAARYTAAKSALTGYRDLASVSDWAADAMAWAVESGIYTGEGGALRPQDKASRALVAQMLYGFAEVIRG